VIGAMGWSWVFSVLPLPVDGGQFYLPSSTSASTNHLVLPVITLSLLPIDYPRRGSAGQNPGGRLRKDFGSTAWAKGLPRAFVVIQHILKNSSSRS